MNSNTNMFKFLNSLTVVSTYKRNPCSLRIRLSYSSTTLFFTAKLQYPLHQIFQSLVEKCLSMRELKRTHAQIILHGLNRHTLILSKLISYCAISEYGDIRYAQLLFDKIQQPNCYMYNSLIRGYSHSEDPDKAIILYKQMILSGILPNEFTFPFVLKACANKAAQGHGAVIHVMAIKLGYESQVFVQNGLVNVYVGCGNISYARKVFDGIREKTLISWNSMIGGYSKMGYCQQAFLMLQRMRESGIEPDDFTFVSLLSVSSQDCNLELGRFVHSYIQINGLTVDVHVQNALLDMYAKGGNLHAAQKVFDQMIDRNVISWTSLLTAYAKHGFVELAKAIFGQMPVKNTVSWNSMISCYVQKGCWWEALDLFFEMCNSRVEPDETTLVIILSACCHIGDLVLGNKLYDYIRGNNIKFTVTLYNALTDMYSKCGSIGKAFDLFLEMPEKNIVSWNVIIGALALHGEGYKAIELFEDMKADGIRPDKITFTGLLCACCHAGLVDTGKYYFDEMKLIYGLTYEIEHYACMIDILGRGGLLDEAVKLVGQMPMRPDAVIWGSLLGACRIYHNISFTKLVFKQLLELKTYTGGLYVLMSNIYSEAQRWGDMKKIRKLMKDHEIKKHNAVSSIDINGCIHEFMANDKRHEASNVIYTVLDQLMDHLKSEGYFCNFSTAFLDAEEI